MPVAEILAGIALVKSSVEFIKSNIDTCKDISELGSHIDALFRGKDEVNKKAGKGPSIRQQFDVAHIAQETIDAKIAAEQLQEIANLINLRFGPGTWQGIIDERARRIQEQKEAQRQARIAKAKADAEMWETIKTTFIVAGCTFAIIALVIGMIWYSRLPAV